jgi:carbonic anhydrase
MTQRQQHPPLPTATQVWRQLIEGNMRFVQGLFFGRNLLDLRRTLTQCQQPQAAVLCCSDSRVPPEIIFDQSLGDLFVVRTAGLVLESTSLGSLEYAVSHLHVPLLVLLGHERCGAVTGAVQHPDLEEGNITAIIRQIAPAAAQARQSGKEGQELVEAATEYFLQLLTDTLHRQSPVIHEALTHGHLGLVVGKYSFQDGRVETLMDSFGAGSSTAPSFPS